MATSTTAARRNKRRKIMAIAAGGVAVGVATVGTLASWTDSEWVFGGGNGPGGDDGVGTSAFEVEQNRATTPPAVGGAGFDDQETNPGGNLIFNVDPSAMTPGDTIYAPVALRTKADSVAGDLTLQPAVAATGKTAVDAGGLLWSNLQYSVRVTDVEATAANCTPAGYASAGTEIVPETTGGLGSPIAPAAQSLLEEAGNNQYYCFRIHLPDNATTQGLQGRKVFPAWEFAAVSN